MIISVTERGTFKRCRQKWDYASFNRQSLEPLRAPTALAFGTMIHKAHEVWLEKPETDINVIVGSVAVATQDRLVERYRTAVGVSPAPQELEAFTDSVSLALEMMQNYEEFYGASLPEGYTLLNAEQTVVIPIPGTEHPCASEFNDFMHMGVPANDELCLHCQGTGVVSHYLEGTFDLLMKDEAGRLWIDDRKTYNSKPAAENLQMNDQFIAYLWLLRQLDIGPIGGFLYDGMWKRSRMPDKGKERPLDMLFHRVPIIHSDEELDNFEAQLRDEVLDMENPRIYRNQRWEGCWDCSDFMPLCQAEFRGEDADYVRQRFYTHRVRTAAFSEETSD